MNDDLKEMLDWRRNLAKAPISHERSENAKRPRRVGLDSATKLVLFTLQAVMYPGKKYFPSFAVIARYSGLSRSTVRDRIGRAERLGWLKRSQRHSDGRLTSNKYTLSIPDSVLAELARKASAKLADAGDRAPGSLGGRAPGALGWGAGRPSTLTSLKDEDERAIALIRFFDQELVATWGTDRARSMPAARDPETAAAWLASGASLALAERVIRSGIAAMRRRGAEPPSALAVFSRNVRTALAAPAPPATNGARSPRERAYLDYLSELRSKGELPARDSLDDRPWAEAMQRAEKNFDARWRADHPGGRDDKPTDPAARD